MNNNTERFILIFFDPRPPESSHPPTPPTLAAYTVSMGCGNSRGGVAECPPQLEEKAEKKENSDRPKGPYETIAIDTPSYDDGRGLSEGEITVEPSPTMVRVRTMKNQLLYSLTEAYNSRRYQDELLPPPSPSGMSDKQLTPTLSSLADAVCSTKLQRRVETWADLCIYPEEDNGHEDMVGDSPISDSETFRVFPDDAVCLVLLFVKQYDKFCAGINMGKIQMVMFVFMCSCVHVFMCSCVHVFMCSCVHVFMCSCVHVFMCSCVHVFMCSCVHVFMCSCVHVFMCSCVHVFMCSCVHVFMCPLPHTQ